MRRIVILLACFACQRANEDQQQKPVNFGSAGVKPRTEQVTPPFDIKTPPADATKTASGLIYKKLVTNDAGEKPKRNDTVLINYTGWRQSTGETFFTNRSRGQPMPLNLATTAPGFTEALQLVRKGEKAMLWVPPSIGYKGAPQGTPETLVYEVEVIDIQPAPAIPENVAKPPDNAESLKSGTKYIVVRPGTGKDKARYFDTVTFNFTAWDNEGRMVDTTEMRKRPATVPPFRQSAAMEEVLTSMTAGERIRFWIDANKMQHDAKPAANGPQGQLCYEVELDSIAKAAKEPPPVPEDVAKPPADAKKSPKGVFYKILKAGKDGKHPIPSDTVKVHYTGWTTDGRMFDSSMIRGEPAEFSLQGVIAGWTDGIPLMGIGDKARFWIPEELAYKGAPGKPQGMLVFDVELLEIKNAPPPPPQHP
jgi:FKBP-type peptidyl-prolyl cis-trans isomerase